MQTKINIKSSLRQVLAKRNINQTGLAKLMDCSPSNIAQIGNGSSLRTIQAICDVLEIKASEFIALGEG